jgi:hypothetical protein
VDNLQVVAIVEDCFGPLCAGDDLAIQFDGHSIAFHPESLNELGEGERSIEGLVFAIDDQAHEDSFRFRVSSFKWARCN